MIGSDINQRLLHLAECNRLNLDTPHPTCDCPAQAQVFELAICNIFSIESVLGGIFGSIEGQSTALKWSRVALVQGCDTSMSNERYPALIEHEIQREGHTWPLRCCLDTRCPQPTSGIDSEGSQRRTNSERSR
jgi:hypothetical protein